MNLNERALSRRLNTGVGLVEVLVALIVLSIGMLGTATLYVTALKAKTTALSRMQAINLAADMADRIRSNRTAGDAYALALGDTPSAPSKTCVTQNCTVEEIAAVDLYNWTQLIQNTLPGDVASSITVNGADPRTYTIFLSWKEPESDQALTYTLEVQV